MSNMSMAEQSPELGGDAWISSVLVDVNNIVLEIMDDIPMTEPSPELASQFAL
jgi:hypothetical protein